MQIANPIYDTVFKFLMDDTPSAILLLSTIMEEEIISLEFLPQENISDLGQHSLTIYRLDFSAKIKTKSGEKQVLIEIQKAKLPSDIMRFRRYLGEQYSKPSNHYQVSKNKKKPLPIVSIYFLGYSLKHIKVPVIKIRRQYHDVVANQLIDLEEEFIESLTHDSYVIQIAHLRAQHQTEIEQLLAIFDQHQHLETDEHILDVDEKNYSSKYHGLIRRLQRAIAEPNVRRNMITEDEMLSDFQGLERIVEETQLELKKKDLALEEQKKLIAQLQQRLNEK